MAKTTHDSNNEPFLTRNPMAIAFGSYLKKRRGTDSGDIIANRLFITTSMLRMIEAGKANLNISRAANLVAVYTDIKLSCLCSILGAINITDTATSSIGSYQKTIGLICDNDISFKPLFDNFTLFFDELKYGKDDEATIVEKLNLDVYVGDFLAGISWKHRDGSKAQRVFQYSLEKVTGIFLDPVFDFLKNIEDLPLHLLGNESAKWEAKNSYRFKDLSCVAMNSAAIIDSKNFEKFDYEYLTMDNFNKARFIFLDEVKSAKPLKIKFKNELIKTVARQNPKLSEKLKIHFDEKVDVRLSHKSNQDIRSFIDDHIPGIADIVWIYRLHNENFIGFFRSSKNSHELNGSTLTYHTANQKYIDFERIFEGLPKED